jgi:hypothetical protein
MVPAWQELTHGSILSQLVGKALPPASAAGPVLDEWPCQTAAWQELPVSTSAKVPTLTQLELLNMHMHTSSGAWLQFLRVRLSISQSTRSGSASIAA